MEREQTETVLPAYISVLKHPTSEPVDKEDLLHSMAYMLRQWLETGEELSLEEIRYLYNQTGRGSKTYIDIGQYRIDFKDVLNLYVVLWESNHIIGHALQYSVRSFPVMENFNWAERLTIMVADPTTIEKYIWSERVN